jgi:DNA modification methylase
MTVKILHGDCRAAMQTLPEGSINCCVTSPPYWGLRDYGLEPLEWPACSYSPMPGMPPIEVPAMSCCLGLEPSVDAFVAHMVLIFREVHRVLRDDGTLWMNFGDSYAGSWGAQGRSGKAYGKHNYSKLVSKRTLSARSIVNQPKKAQPVAAFRSAGIKPKDMYGIPWRVAFALQADGWWLRQDIVWSKPNPMPESTRDRCTKSHEYVFLLAKSRQYYYDFEAMQEPVNGGAHARRPVEYSGAKRPGFGHGYDANPKPRYRTEEGWGEKRVPSGWATGTDRAHTELDGNFTGERNARVGRREGPPGNPAERQPAKASGREQQDLRTSAAFGRDAGWRNKNNTSMAEALAGVRDTRNRRSVWTVTTAPFKEAHFATFPPALVEPCIAAGCPIGGTVLDPFGGAGTTGLVADRLHRNAVLIELNPAYVEIARKRIHSDAPLLAEVQA